MKPFFKDTIKESKPSLVMFVSEDNQNDPYLKSIEEELKLKYGDSVNILKVDVSYDRHLIEEYKIHEYPTWILFKESQELMRESGKKTLEELSAMTDRGL